ncbi:MAG: beta-N-acetylglucosaminidase domain-containing protein [bacterium]|nr:beta-N-acetylglucosaminidase domain-containing protein [bacterium]
MKHVPWKNLYSIGHFYSFGSSIPIHSNLVFSPEIQDLINRFLHTTFVFSNDEEALSIKHSMDQRILPDGFVLDTRQRSIELKYSTLRGLLYGIESLNALVKKTSTGHELPIVLIEDEPDFERRGIIEGYYGTPWTFEERHEMFAFMHEHRMNAYMYAPKMDPYHRDLWRVSYPQELLDQLSQMVSRSKEYLIDMWMCISPAHHAQDHHPIDYASKEDLSILFQKMTPFIDMGITKFGLLYDDIDFALQGKSQELFGTPGNAHAMLANEFLAFLQTKIAHPELVICPTEYHEIGSSPYREDLKNGLNPNIAIFWTGDNVVAEVISQEDIVRTKVAFDKPLFIWDNFPVSDFTYGVREFIAPIQNRSVSLYKHSKGYFINPSVHYHLSKVGMISMASFAWNGGSYQKEASFFQALDNINPSLRLLGLDFFYHNYPSALDHSKQAVEHLWVEESKFKEILDYYANVVKASNRLLELHSPFIEELSPWLKRTICEAFVASSILSTKATKQNIIEFLQDTHFAGSELIDYLILKNDYLSTEEYNRLITSKRGRTWYRVFEAKRWQK